MCTSYKFDSRRFGLKIDGEYGWLSGVDVFMTFEFDNPDELLLSSLHEFASSDDDVFIF